LKNITQEAKVVHYGLRRQEAVKLKATINEGIGVRARIFKAGSNWGVVMEVI